MGLVVEDRENKFATLMIAGGWLLLFLAVIWAYFPGLGGPFVLDDFGSIAAMGHRGGVVDWDTFRAFVFGGGAGPTGRPIALLSFLVDATDWPAEAWPFKRTNLVIHLLNGALLGLVTYQVLRVVQHRHLDAMWIALLSAAFWLLHPFLVSTTLYAVQRMTQLSTLFVLAGLAFYIHGRVSITASPKKAYAKMTAAVGFFTLLAMLSKENGVLLPLLIGVLELTVFASERRSLPALSRIWLTLFLVVPTMVIALYLGERVSRDNFFDIVPPRDFSIYERLLTQPRILGDYLQHWFIPKLYTSGVFQDHFLKSTGLLTPITTLLAALFHGTAIALAFAYRRRWPIASFAILFFYGGHVLESTVINLELYFEHRNYLPTAFLVLPLAVAAYTKLRGGIYAAAIALTVLVLAGFTHYSASVWASIPDMVEASARKAPTSARAQAQYSVMLFNSDRYAESLDVLDRAIENIPTPNPLLKVNRLITLCHMRQLSAAEFDSEAQELSKAAYDARSITVYTALAETIVAGKCPNVAATELSALFTQMLQVPGNTDRTSLEYSHIKYLEGFSDAFSGRPQEAVAAFGESLEARPGANHAMMMAAVLATNNYSEEALNFSELALAQLGAQQTSSLRGAPVNESDIRVFQATVRADLEASKAADTSHQDQ